MTKGFTLIELLVVVVIIGILSAIALPQYDMAVENARRAEGMVIAKAMSDANQRYIQAYPNENGACRKGNIADVDLKGGCWSSDTSCPVSGIPLAADTREEAPEPPGGLHSVCANPDYYRTKHFAYYLTGSDIINVYRVDTSVSANAITSSYIYKFTLDIDGNKTCTSGGTNEGANVCNMINNL